MFQLLQQQVALSVLQQQLTQCKEPGSGWATKTTGMHTSFIEQSQWWRGQDKKLLGCAFLTTCAHLQHHR
jgi:hypothetical protein